MIKDVEFALVDFSLTGKVLISFVAYGFFQSWAHVQHSLELLNLSNDDVSSYWCIANWKEC